MESIWIVRIEVIAYIDSAPSTGQLGFINVVASAATAAEAQNKVIHLVKQYQWEILSIEDTSIADPASEYNDDLSDLIDDVTLNPAHIRLSTLHTYRPN
jgi:hypothetical protein